MSETLDDPFVSLTDSLSRYTTSYDELRALRHKAARAFGSQLSISGEIDLVSHEEALFKAMSECINSALDLASTVSERDASVAVAILIRKKLLQQTVVCNYANELYGNVSARKTGRLPTDFVISRNYLKQFYTEQQDELLVRAVYKLYTGRTLLDIADAIDQQQIIKVANQTVPLEVRYLTYYEIADSLQRQYADGLTVDARIVFKAELTDIIREFDAMIGVEDIHDRLVVRLTTLHRRYRIDEDMVPSVVSIASAELFGL